MSYDSVILADNPIAYWKLEELVLPTVLPNSFCIDSSGNGFDGSLLRASDGLIAGITGPILTDSPSYGMQGGVARIPNAGNAAGSLNPLDAQTWECWAKTQSTGCETMMNRGGDVSTDYMSFGQRGTGNFPDHAYFVLDFGVDGGRDVISCALQLDTWYHIAGVRDGTFMGLYVNSWLVDSRNDCPAHAITDPANPWRLGYMTNLVFGVVNVSEGLSHCAVYNRNIGQSKLAEHVIAALGDVPASPCEGATSASVTMSASGSPSASPSSSPSASPAPCTPPLGAAISCIDSRGRLFVTLASEDEQSQTVFAWHEGAERMPISSMTNWKPSLRALTLQELNIAFETDNADPLNPMIVSVTRNLRKNYVRDARVEAGSNRVDSLTALFDSDNIGDMIAVFGHNIGGSGVHYILGRIEALSSPSSSPSPSASPSASPSTTESPSPSLSPSASPSTSRSGSPSPSHSPSSSPSASPSRSRSSSVSATPSASPSSSPSRSPSASPSAS